MCNNRVSGRIITLEFKRILYSNNAFFGKYLVLSLAERSKVLRTFCSLSQYSDSACIGKYFVFCRRMPLSPSRLPYCGPFDRCVSILSALVGKYVVFSQRMSLSLSRLTYCGPFDRCLNTQIVHLLVNTLCSVRVCPYH